MKKLLLFLFLPLTAYAGDIRTEAVENRAVSQLNDNIRRLEVSKIDKTPAELHPRRFFFPRASAIRGTLVPGDIGEAYQNSLQLNQVCIATATNSSAWVLLSTGTTAIACPN